MLMAIHDALVKIYDGSEPAVFNTSILQKGLAAAGVLAHAKGLALLQGQQGTAEVESALFALIENDSETELEVRHSPSRTPTDCEIDNTCFARPPPIDQIYQNRRVQGARKCKAAARPCIPAPPLRLN